MAFPAGVELCSISAGRRFAALGGLATITMTVQPYFGTSSPASITWVATGDSYDSVAELASLGTDTVSVQVPVVNQVGWADSSGAAFTMWAYIVTVAATYENGERKTATRNVSPVSGQTTIDFDTVPSSAITAPSVGAIVTSGSGVPSDDPRLSDARTPTAHKASHATGGTDALSPADIGAATAGHGHTLDAVTDTGTRVAMTPAERTKLGGVASGATAVSYGTTAGTAAQGNDVRITGAAQKAANLADLASAVTARTNLGLGGSATLNVGTAVGTVAAGNDARFDVATVTTAALDALMGV